MITYRYIILFIIFTQPLSAMKKIKKVPISQDSSPLAQPLLPFKTIDEDNLLEYDEYICTESSDQNPNISCDISLDPAKSIQCIKLHGKQAAFMHAGLNRMLQKSCSADYKNETHLLFVHATTENCTIQDVMKHGPHEVPLPRESGLQLHELMEQRLREMPAKVEIEAMLMSSEYLHRKMINAIYTNFHIHTIALHHNGRRIAISGSKNKKHSLLIYHLDHGIAFEKYDLLESKHPIHLLSFSPDEDRLLFACSYLDKERGYQRRSYARILSLRNRAIITELADFEEVLKVHDFACGWPDEETIVAYKDNKPLAAWKLPSKTPTNGK